MKGLLVSFTDATYPGIYSELIELSQDLWAVQKIGTGAVEIVIEENNFRSDLQASLFVYCADWNLYNHLVNNPPTWVGNRRLLLMVPEPCPVIDAGVVHFESASRDTLLGLGMCIQDSWDLQPIQIPKRDVVAEVVDAMNAEGKSFISRIHPMFYEIPAETRQQTRAAVNAYVLGAKGVPKNLPPKLFKTVLSEECDYLRSALAHLAKNGLADTKKQFPEVHPHDLSYFTSRTLK